MTKLKYFNFNNKFSKLDFLITDLNDNSFIKTKELLIAHTKFFELSQKISQGNYSLYHISITSHSVAYFNICNTILAYQACYDYMLQIFYFGFGFNKDFNDTETYRHIINKDCRLRFIDIKENQVIKTKQDFKCNKFEKDLVEYCNQDTHFKEFFIKFYNNRQFLNHPEYGISQWANCIKHQGGFLTTELFDNELKRHLSFYSNDSSQSFSTSELYAHKPTTEEVIKRLREQNKKIVGIAEWLFEQFFPKRQIKAFQTRPLPIDNQILS